VRWPEGRSGEALERAGDREHPASSRGVGSDAGQVDPGRGREGKLLSPSRRRACVDHVMTELSISERRACRALGQHRSTQRKIPTTPGDEVALTADIIELARQYGRYGYRRITAMLRSAGWTVNKKRVERIWRCEGLHHKHQRQQSRIWIRARRCNNLYPAGPKYPSGQFPFYLCRSTASAALGAATNL